MHLISVGVSVSVRVSVSASVGIIGRVSIVKFLKYFVN